MGTLVFVCPATGEEVSTGIEMDLATLSQLDLAKVFCSHCRQPHHMVGVEYWLSQIDEPAPLEETAEAGIKSEVSNSTFAARFRAGSRTRALLHREMEAFHCLTMKV